MIQLNHCHTRGTSRAVAAWFTQQAGCVSYLTELPGKGYHETMTPG
jgi:hypothetical protein